jgi:hypothetical protein
MKDSCNRPDNEQKDQEKRSENMESEWSSSSRRKFLTTSLAVGSTSAALGFFAGRGSGGEIGTRNRPLERAWVKELNNPTDGGVYSPEITTNQISIKKSTSLYRIPEEQQIDSDIVTDLNFSKKVKDEIGSMDTSTNEWSPDYQGTYRLEFTATILDLSDDSELLGGIITDGLDRKKYVSGMKGHTVTISASALLEMNTDSVAKFAVRQQTGKTEVVDSRGGFTELRIYRIG